MFDIGWSEMAVIALLALLVIGPKELPNLMRNVARWVKKARSLTREFQSGIDDMVREADLEDARNALKQTTSSGLEKKITDAIDPTGGVTDSLNEIKRETESTTAVPPLAGGDGKADSATESTERTESAEATPEPSIEVPPAQVAPAHSLSSTPDPAPAPTPEPEEAEVVGADAGAEAPKTAGKTG